MSYWSGEGKITRTTENTWNSLSSIEKCLKKICCSEWQITVVYYMLSILIFYYPFYWKRSHRYFSDIFLIISGSHLNHGPNAFFFFCRYFFDSAILFMLSVSFKGLKVALWLHILIPQAAVLSFLLSFSSFSSSFSFLLMLFFHCSYLNPWSLHFFSLGFSFPLGSHQGVCEQLHGIQFVAEIKPQQQYKPSILQWSLYSR